MRIYTRGGDDGQTSTADGSRRDKHNLRVTAYGTIDEAGAFVGLAVAHMQDALFSDCTALLMNIQMKLFDVGADIARGGIPPNGYQFRTELEDVVELERLIDRYQEQAPAVKRFVLRGGTKEAAFLHAACVVVRRAEREVSRLKATEEVHRPALVYLNRLSDLLFVLARVANARAGQADILYERGGDVFR